MFLGKFANIERRASKRNKRVMYHGSNAKFDRFEPKYHELADGDRVVFGTPLRAMAVAGMGRWTDDDFDQGTYNDEELLHMRELKPGALERVYKGKRGYLYELDPESFEHGGEQYMPTEFISKTSPKIVKRTEVDAYEAMLAEERAGRLKIHRMQKQAAKRKKAVIIKGNPYYLEQGPDTAGYAAYYKDIENELRSAGYDDVVYDRGDPMTSPPPADLWVGHSRGASRLRFAPKGTKTLNITEYEDGINEYKAKILKEMRKRGYSSVDEFPVEERPRPGREHFTLTQRGRDALRKQAAAPRDYKREYRLFHSSPEAKRNRAKRNLWNRRLKGKVPEGYEIDHKHQLRDGGGNGRDNIRFMRVSKNRAEHNRGRVMRDYMRKESSALKGAIIGGGLGGMIGAADSPDGMRMRNAVGGAIIGSALGGGIGAMHRMMSPATFQLSKDQMAKLPKGFTGDMFVRDGDKIRRLHVNASGKVTIKGYAPEMASNFGKSDLLINTTKTASFNPYQWVYDSLVKEAGKKRRPRIALVRGSLGGDESLSNASANAYAEALRNEGFDIDEVDLSDVPFTDEWDDDYKNKHRALLRESDATVFATPVYNWGPSARVNAYLQNAVKAGEDPYRPYAVLGAAGSQRSQGYLTSLQNSLAMEDKGINVGAPLVATEEDMIYKGEKLKGVSDKYRERLAEHAAILAHLARNRRKNKMKKTAAAVATKRDPDEWEAAKREAKAKMGGKHSARAMQLATQIYKKKGGTYEGKKPSASKNKLRKWTKQDWQWSGGDTPGDGGRGVYLPKRSTAQLKSTRSGISKLRAAEQDKREATTRGYQFAAHGLHVGKNRGAVS